MSDTKNLPEGLTAYPSMQSITALIGEAKASDLSWILGGKTLYIPRNPGPHSPLSEVIGVEDARAIGEIYGGMEMVMPISLGKRAEMRRMIRQNRTVNEIVRHLRCARGTVYRCRREIFNERQLDLFDPPFALLPAPSAEGLLLNPPLLLLPNPLSEGSLIEALPVK